VRHAQSGCQLLKVLRTGTRLASFPSAQYGRADTSRFCQSGEATPACAVRAQQGPEFVHGRTVSQSRTIVYVCIDIPSCMDYGTCMHDNASVHPIKAALQRRWPPMSQAKLARALDMNPSVLGRYLNGQGTPPEGFYIAVAAVLGVDIETITPQEGVAA
jgi:hypothetical protein